MPGARCTRSLACEIKKHTSVVTTVTPERPGIPRAMVLRLTSRSPRGPGLFDTVACASYRRLDASIGAPERHDLTVRFSAIRQRRRRVHRIPPRVDDVAQRPSEGRDSIAIVLICPRRQAKFRKIGNWWGGCRWCAGWLSQRKRGARRKRAFAPPAQSDITPSP